MNRTRRRGVHGAATVPRNHTPLRTPFLLALLSSAFLAAPAIGAPRRPKPAASPGQTADGEGWKALFDGKSFKGWKVTEFAGAGEVRVEKSFRGGPAAIVVGTGETLSGCNWTGEVPKTRYEIGLEVMKIDGSDFMCGLTFPVGESHASLILGGWGGGIVGISSIDDQDASENATSRVMSFPLNRWYRVRLRGIQLFRVAVW